DDPNNLGSGLLGKIVASNNKKIVIRDPGVQVQLARMICKDINTPEPGWEVEIAFSLEITAEVPGAAPDTRTWKFGTSFDYTADTNKSYVAVDYDDPDESGIPERTNLLGDPTIFSIPQDKLGQTTLTILIPFVEEVDDSSGDDTMKAKFGDGSNKATVKDLDGIDPSKPLTIHADLDETDSVTKVDAYFTIAPVKAFTQVN
ncbi:MAG: hypothetical protein AAF585_21505, partial [Verrucomicrobiota bacterium]